MVTIKFIDSSGIEHAVQAAEGASAMEAARDSGVPEIGGHCGGNASCGTCHVFVDAEWREAAGEPDPEIELPVLELLDGVRQGSRLACQIKLRGALEHLVLRTPQGQC
jgi:2Fe-2S ferredoxin